MPLGIEVAIEAAFAAIDIDEQIVGDAEGERHDAADLLGLGDLHQPREHFLGNILRNVGAPGADGFGTLLQGYTEASNVDAVTEITALIVAQRAYEMNSKVISAADEMLQAANAVKS